MKSINWGKGFYRLTYVLSFIAGFAFRTTVAKSATNYFERLLAFLIGAGIVWVIYFIIRYVVRGFTSKDS